MKNSTPENKIDQALEMMKEQKCPENGFKSVEQFKADFFRKAEEENKMKNEKSTRKNSRFIRFAITAAAAAAVCVGTVLWMQTGDEETIGLELGCRTAEVNRVVSREPDKLEKTVECIDAGVPMPEVSYSPKAKMMVGSMAAVERNVMRRVPAPENPAPEIVPANTEEYKHVDENGFKTVASAPLSTFGADVDTAGFTNVRRFLMQDNSLPPQDAVRTEEFLNYFQYDYKGPAADGDAAFHVNFESMDAPWSKDRKLLLVGVQAKKVEKKNLPPSNFVFLIDNSGSMRSVFPMVKDAMSTLADQMRENDRISIVTYGGGVNVLMDGASGANKDSLKKQIAELTYGGYTPGGAGIIEAYKLAHKHFIKGGNNRIVLITDGDFNVGVSSESALVEMVEKERKSAIYLSAFGVGFGNYKDNKLKMLANKGNGNYTYLDNVREAKRVMTNEMSGKMFTLAKDVKFQIEFNPAKVAAYRLVGYELRKLNDQDFNDDTKDSGEVGVGHQVTAVYELIMADAAEDVRKKYLGSVDPLKYQTTGKTTGNSEILTFKLRYQKPEGTDPSRLLTFELKEMPAATENIRWASAVTEFTLLLKDSAFKENADYAALRKRAQANLGEDDEGKRAEFLTMVRAAEDLSADPEKK